MKFLNEIKDLSLSFEGTPVSPGHLSQLISDFENTISGLSKPGLVLLQEKNPVKFIIAFFGLLDHGHTPVSIPSEMSSYQFDIIENDLYHPASFVNGVLKLATGEYEVLHKKSYACLTSGTTGSPKLCFFSTVNAFENAKAHCDSLSIASKDEVIQSLPLYHSYGIVVYLFSWIERKFKLDLNMIFLGMRALSKRNLQNTVLNISPAQLRFMLKEKCDTPSGIKLISIGGGSIDSESLEQFALKFPAISLYLTYGLTEAGPRVSTGLWKNHQSGYIGKAISGVETKVLVGREVEDSGFGRLLIYSPTLKLNLGQEEMHGKYLVTRDMVTLDESGSIYFKTRDDDLINYGGISVYPMDIENVARRCDQVHDAQVMKVKSKFYEEEPILFVEPEVDIEQLRDFMKEKLSVHQMPKKIIALKKLPRTSLNKVDRKALMLRLS